MKSWDAPSHALLLWYELTSLQNKPIQHQRMDQKATFRGVSHTKAYETPKTINSNCTAFRFLWQTGETNKLAIPAVFTQDSSNNYNSIQPTDYFITFMSACTKFICPNIQLGTSAASAKHCQNYFDFTWTRTFDAPHPRPLMDSDILNPPSPNISNR